MRLDKNIIIYFLILIIDYEGYEIEEKIILENSFMVICRIFGC